MLVMPFPAIAVSVDRPLPSRKVRGRVDNPQLPRAFAVLADHPLHPDNNLAVAMRIGHLRSPDRVASCYTRRSARHKRNTRWEHNPMLGTRSPRSNNTIRHMRKLRGYNGPSTNLGRAIAAYNSGKPYIFGLASFGFLGCVCLAGN